MPLFDRRQERGDGKWGETSNNMQQSSFPTTSGPNGPCLSLCVEPLLYVGNLDIETSDSALH